MAASRKRKRPTSAQPERKAPPPASPPAAKSAEAKAGGRAVWLFPLVVLAFGFLIYAPALSGPFVLDDYDLQEGFSAVLIGDWKAMRSTGRPILMATFVANHRLAGGFDPGAFHATNILIHCLNAILLWRLALLLFPAERLGARLAAFRPLFVYGLPLLFLASPIQTESVAYVSSRSELLSTFFYLAALWAFTKFRDRNAVVAAAIVMVCFVLTAWSKQDKLTLPFAILLLDYLWLSRREWRGLLKSWPTYGLFAVGVVAGYFVVVRPFLYAPSAGFTLDWKTYLFTQFRMYFRYFGQLVYPFGLNADPHIAPSTSLGEHGSWLALLGLIAIAAALIRFHRRTPLPVFGGALFFLALGPTTSFYPLLDYAAERRLYLPAIGFFLVVVWALARSSDARSKVPYAVVGVLLAVYAAGTYQRSTVWADELRLWEDTVAKSPGKGRPWMWMGRVLFNRGRLDPAVRAWERAAELLPPDSDEYPYVLSNLGLAAAHAKQYERAIGYYRRAIEAKPREAMFWGQLAVAQMRLGRTEEGWESFRKGFAAPGPAPVGLRALRGQERYQAGRYEEAAEDFEAVLRATPDDPEAARNLRAARQAAGRRDR
jgi:protein O-mannosyl-transferase